VLVVPIAAPDAADASPTGAEPSKDGENTPSRRRRLTLPAESRPAPRRKSGIFSSETTAPRRKTGSVPIPPERAAAGRSGSFPSFDGPRRKSGTVTAIDFDPLPRNRATELLEMLDRAGGSPDMQRIVDDLVVAAEQAARDGDLDVVADAAIGLSTRRAQPRGDDRPRLCAAAVARLFTPSFLRLLPRAAGRSRPRADAIQAVLHETGDDGAAAVIAEVTLAPTLADRRRCFEMLLKLPSAVGVLSRMLGAAQWHVARNAADLLGELHATEAHAALSTALQHADERVRRAAAHALAKLGTQPAVQSLRTALVDPSARVRVQVAAGLANRKGTKSATTLTRALDEESDVEVQLAILSALGRLGTPDAVNRLIKAAEPDGRLFKKKPVAFRVAAVHALGEIRTTAARSMLQSQANDKESEVREAVLRVVMQAPRGESSES
jgi:HEAT repeat protein